MAFQPELAAVGRIKSVQEAAKARGVVLLEAVRDRAVARLKADANRFAKNVDGGASWFNLAARRDALKGGGAMRVLSSPFFNVIVLPRQRPARSR